MRDNRSRKVCLLVLLVNLMSILSAAAVVGTIVLHIYGAQEILIIVNSVSPQVGAKASAQT